MKTKNNLTKLVKNKQKLLYSSIVLFVLTSLILKFIPNNIGNKIALIIFPVYFLIYSLLHIKSKKINWN